MRAGSGAIDYDLPSSSSRVPSGRTKFEKEEEMSSSADGAKLKQTTQWLQIYIAAAPRVSSAIIACSSLTMSSTDRASRSSQAARTSSTHS